MTMPFYYRRMRELNLIITFYDSYVLKLVYTAIERNIFDLKLSSYTHIPTYFIYKLH